MGHKVYILIRGIRYEGEDTIGVYSHEHLAAAECVRLNNLPKRSDVCYYVETWDVLDA